MNAWSIEQILRNGETEKRNVWGQALLRTGEAGRRDRETSMLRIVDDNYGE